MVMNRQYLAGLFIFTALLVPAAHAGEQQPQVSVINLQVVTNAQGGQSVITPKGDLAPLPGSGVDGSVAQIYFGSQGGFWYSDKRGQTIDLTPTVQELQARRAQQVPQYAPVPEQSAQNNSGSSAMATAAAAAGGAAVGTALTRGYYNAPYGTPMYYGNQGPYYYNNGERREIDELNQNQKQAIYNKRQVENQQKQQLVDQRQSNQQARQTQQDQRQAGGQQADFQRQQQWYQQELKNSSRQWHKQAENPFASQQFSRDSFAQGRSEQRVGRDARQSDLGGGRSRHSGGRSRSGGGRRGR
jgi:hypothetical protein